MLFAVTYIAGYKDETLHVVECSYDLTGAMADRKENTKLCKLLEIDTDEEEDSLEEFKIVPLEKSPQFYRMKEGNNRK